MTRLPWDRYSITFIQTLLGRVLFVAATGGFITLALLAERGDESALGQPAERATATVVWIGPRSALDWPEDSPRPQSDQAIESKRPALVVDLADDQTSPVDVTSAEDEMALTLRYHNQEVDGTVEVDLDRVRLEQAWLGDDQLAVAGVAPLSVGRQVEIAYRPNDPYLVSRWVRSPTYKWAWFAGVSTVAIVGAIATYTVWLYRRLDALAGALGGRVLPGTAVDIPRFAMLGVLVRSRLTADPILDLYPLDARTGDRGTCSIPLADLSINGNYDRCFPVEVAGLPRIGGLLVAKADGKVLRPKGRALITAPNCRPGYEGLSAGLFNARVISYRTLLGAVVRLLSVWVVGAVIYFAATTNWLMPIMVWAL